METAKVSTNIRTRDQMSGARAPVAVDVILGIRLGRTRSLCLMATGVPTPEREPGHFFGAKSASSAARESPVALFSGRNRPAAGVKYPQKLALSLFWTGSATG